MFLSFIVIKRKHCTACQIAEEEERRIGQELKPAGAHILMFIKILSVKEVPVHTHLCLLVIIGVSGVIKRLGLHIHYQQAKNKARYHKERNKQVLMSEEK